MPRGLTVMDKLLVSALGLEESGRSQFSAEDLVVMAWRQFPDAFGLAGYLDDRGVPLYPDSNRVYMEIMGSKPLRKRGLLQKVGSKVYQLTEAGRSHALKSRDMPIDRQPKKLTLARERIEQLRRLFDSKAARKVRADELADVSFFDACGFWGINARSGAKDLWSRFAHVEALLDATAQLVGSGETGTPRHGAIPYTADDLRRLRGVHDALRERFSKEIDVIKGRTDER